MSKRDGITATMVDALDMAQSHGGELVRYVGGFWSWRSCPRGHNGHPVESFGSSTVEALVARKRLEYSEWKEGRGGRFPIAAKLVAEAVAA